MLVKINGIPIDTKDVADIAVDGFKQVTNFITQDATIDIAYGGHHFVSADLNPINAPHHIADGIVNVGHLIANLF